MSESTLPTHTDTETAPRRPFVPAVSAWSALQTVISTAIVVATLFTLWTPNNLFSNKLLDEMLFALQSTQSPTAADWPTPTAVPRSRIGIVAGHWGNDSGAVCPDGLTEVEVNLKIATLVKQFLTEEGYEVDLLQEYDDRLYQYQGMVLISIHNDSCDYINNEATGFKVAAAIGSPFPEKNERLTACLIHRYQTATGLNFHYNTITSDMTSYHAFDEINSVTTAAIIETGFMNLDRQILTEQTDRVAKAVAAGILCYARNEHVPQLESAPGQ